MNEDKITLEDAKLLETILECWNKLSNMEEGNPELGYAFMTDHRHWEFDCGEELLRKLKRMGVESPNDPSSAIRDGNLN